MKTFLLLLASLAMTVSAADINGNWKGSAETPNGTFERTFMFKADGHKLTGTTTSDRTGESKITDGKIEGDSITFSINVKIQDNELKLDFKGKMTGDTIKFNVEGGNGMTIEYNVKKVS